MTSRPIKILLGKLGLDGHDRGVQVVAQGLVDAGMEVVYLGLRQTPRSMAKAAMEEDVDVVGVSSLSGAHKTLFPELKKELQNSEMDHVMLMGGGVIPEGDIPELLKCGYHCIFTPGTPLEDITASIKKHVER